MDEEYKYEDLGFTFTIAPVGEIVTDPGFRPGEWYVRHADEQGIFVVPLDHELAHFDGNDPLWDKPAKAVFSPDNSVIMLFRIENTAIERKMITLLHRSAAEAYISDIM